MKLTQTQITACTLLLEGNDTQDVALQVGKNKTTICRWTKLPEFVQMLNEGKQIAFQEAGIRLARTSFKAAVTLEKIMDDLDAKPEIRLKAATEILNYGLRLSEQLDLTQRIIALEALAKVDDDG
jgi:hypothetical protein